LWVVGEKEAKLSGGDRRKKEREFWDFVGGNGVSFWGGVFFGGFFFFGVFVLSPATSAAGAAKKRKVREEGGKGRTLICHQASPLTTWPVNHFKSFFRVKKSKPPSDLCGC